MGAVSIVTAAVAALSAHTAMAQSTPQVQSPQVQAPQMEGRRRMSNDPERLAPFGLMLDAGMPEGAGLSGVLRPSQHLRIHLGGAHNGLRGALRAGLTLLPLKGKVSPSFSWEFGHAQAASTKTLNRRLADSTQLPASSMERVGYTYISTHVGLEFNATRRLSFFVRGGMSFMEMDVPSLQKLDEPFRDSLSPVETQSWMMRKVQPSGKLGLTFFFG
ncbi:hypothetical protein COCOR_06623 [Corallococcus coralloides DSM 2259]|uniref:Outer membrane protein beta-barrel domain-containing protein n=1 Tax=Corallococcus coralloides (strain ATCC 25202 / DSM 2259 / NBRC 100086 / M2) TaxID=1144275 RepID=H8MW78_CORCM|nr:hypothetical protein [Corallococcus coralloides]AFE07020.1 hypothetical protein COCOR_06623 [Corallococcus coralloides DSM 2259]